jgi:threonine/homoserine/homoserine lactone efflux protein
MDRAAILDHEFLIAAYVVTWVIQLSYLAWLGLKWRAETRAARRRREAAR